MPDQLQMTDQELVAKVAEKVMGWTFVPQVWDRDAGGVQGHWRGSRGQRYRLKDMEESGLIAPLWSPRDDWNHAMMVVKAMREKGFRFDWNDDGANPEIGFLRGDNHWSKRAPSTDETAQRRAILVAALKALQGEVFP